MYERTSAMTTLEDWRKDTIPHHLPRITLQPGSPMPFSRGRWMAAGQTPELSCRWDYELLHVPLRQMERVPRRAAPDTQILSSPIYMPVTGKEELVLWELIQDPLRILRLVPNWEPKLPKGEGPGKAACFHHLNWVLTTIPKTFPCS